MPIKKRITDPGAIIIGGGSLGSTVLHPDLIKEKGPILIVANEPDPTGAEKDLAALMQEEFNRSSDIAEKIFPIVAYDVLDTTRPLDGRSRRRERRKNNRKNKKK